jgi:hypothetical protein
MFKFLKNNDGVLPLLSAVLLLLYSVVNVLINGLPEYHAIFQSEVDGWLSWMLWFAQIMLVYGVLFMTNRVFQQFQLLTRMSNLPLFFGVLTYFAVPSSYAHPFAWIALGIMLAYVSSLFGAMMGERPKQNAFWSGFALGSASWFFTPALFFFPLFVQSGFSSGMLTLRRLIIHVVGFLLPTYLVLMLVYLFKDDVIYPVWMQVNWTMFNLDLANFWTLAYAIVCFALLFSAVLIGLKSSTIREKRRFYLMVTMAVFSLLAGFFYDAGVWLLLFVVPSSVVFSRLFQQIEKRWVYETLFLVYVVLIVGLNI